MKQIKIITGLKPLPKDHPYQKAAKRSEERKRLGITWWQLHNNKN